MELAKFLLIVLRLVVITDFMSQSDDHFVEEMLRRERDPAYAAPPDFNVTLCGRTVQADYPKKKDIKRRAKDYWEADFE